MLAQLTDARPLDVAAFEALVCFNDDPGTWLPYPAQRAGSGWLVAVAAGRVTWTVHVTVGDVVHEPEAHLRMVHWTPRAHPERHQGTYHLLPQLDGELLLREDGDATRLALRATYTVPGGAAGAVIDAAGMHRIAEATTTRFLEDVARNLCRSPGRPARAGMP